MRIGFINVGRRVALVRAGAVIVATLTMLPATIATAETPVPITVSASGSGTCALMSDATIRCWGGNNKGGLGDGTTTSSTLPVTVETAPGVPFGGVLQMDATCAVTDDHRAWCWGNNSAGQLGIGKRDANAHPRPRQVMLDGVPLEGVASIDLGNIDTCASKLDGSAWCWGDRSTGQVGDGTRDESAPRTQPVRVRRGAGFLGTVSSISAAVGFHSCARTDDGSLFCWGNNSEGAVGDGTIGPWRLKAVRVKQGPGLFTDASSVSVGLGFTCASKANGSAWCWGTNHNATLGDGTRTQRSLPVRVRQGAGFLSSVAEVDAGDEFHACARTTDGSAWCWGDNSYGQLGDGTRTRRLKATRVRTAVGPLAGVIDISAGTQHACALLDDGSIWCWGRNFYGELGDGTTATRLVATRVLLP